jgi:hypothetical protein
MSQHKEQQGFLTIAVNTPEVDYLSLAYLQALNIKHTQKINRYAIVVDKETSELLEDKHRSVFDYIIEIDKKENPFEIEPRVFWLTPFKETIKLESDLLFTRSIDHWWDSFRIKDVVLSVGCKNYLGHNSLSRKYRKILDDNELPDTYNGLMYFRFSQTGANFFRKAQEIFDKWDMVKLELNGCEEDIPSTDVVYSIATNLIGRELCTIPTADFINFVHMKPAINGYPDGTKFTDVFLTEFNDGMIRINNINQYHPIHYHEKDFITDEMIEYYESRRVLG